MQYNSGEASTGESGSVDDAASDADRNALTILVVPFRYEHLPEDSKAAGGVMLTEHGQIAAVVTLFSAATIELQDLDAVFRFHGYIDRATMPNLSDAHLYSVHPMTLDPVELDMPVVSVAGATPDGTIGKWTTLSPEKSRPSSPTYRLKAIRLIRGVPLKFTFLVSPPSPFDKPAHWLTVTWNYKVRHGAHSIPCKGSKSFNAPGVDRN